MVASCNDIDKRYPLFLVPTECYVLHTNARLTWYEARDDCISRGMHLAVIRNDDQTHIVTLKLFFECKCTLY